MLLAIHALGCCSAELDGSLADDVASCWVPDCAVKQSVWCNWVAEQLHIQNGLLENNSSIALAPAQAEFGDCLFHESCIATVATGLCKGVVQPRVPGTDEGASVAHHCMVAPDIQIFAAQNGLILRQGVHACAAAWDKFDTESEAQCHDKLVIWTLGPP